MTALARPVPTTGTGRAGARRAAITGGVIGNHVDQVNIFLPALAPAPAMKNLAGPGAAASGTAIVVMAMLLGRPVGATLFGRIADRAGRTRTTATCLLGVAGERAGARSRGPGGFRVALLDELHLLAPTELDAATRTARRDP